MSRGFIGFLVCCCFLILVGCSDKSPQIPENAKAKNDTYCYSYETTDYVDCYPFLIQDIEEHLQLIKDTLILEDRTDADVYFAYVEESLAIVHGLEEEFKRTQEKYGQESDAFLEAVQEIIHCVDEDCMTQRLAMQHDTIPPEEWKEFNETLTTLFEEYFTLFLLNEHYNKTFGDQRFIKNIHTSQTRLSKLKTRTEKEWQSLMASYHESDTPAASQEIEKEKIKEENQTNNQLADPQPVESNETTEILISYTIDKSGFVSINGPTDSVIRLKVGQKIHLKPTFIGEAYQKLYVYGGVVDFLDEYTVIARQSGTTDLEIVPNWEWELSKVYTVFVE
ncbi:hypothetical protein [Alkalihalobacterium chitinilyticum]|uniref:DUF3221 domain-containing protein n=1 Tax=Alkalihalobacterium chitinilyticum TaxID=2980103 RepID=A0ABT5VET4_9BACI|nr:hypothetical protein [Alkalihalobacterium chitinilyticum]MDE5413975.1 hypothetical protein [Alkalihalobacterium chitinilyticum]